MPTCSQREPRHQHHHCARLPSQTLLTNRAANSVQQSNKYFFKYRINNSTLEGADATLPSFRNLLLLMTQQRAQIAQSLPSLAMPEKVEGGPRGGKAP